VNDNGLDIFRYTPPYGPEDMQREIDILRAALAKSNAERDEARRLCCERAAMDEGGYVKHGTMLHFAESRGWDCFNKNPTGNA